MSHVRAIAATPRPTGSEAHRNARRYLLAELRTQGVETRVQQSNLAWVDARGRVRSHRPANVVARLPGSDGDEAILLVAHYDSVPHSPGAGDNAAAVAALLETIRVLQQDPHLERSVIALFSDLEEEGLSGAQAFIDDDPWFDDVVAVVNFEGRGSSGPSLLFETGSGSPVSRAAAVTPTVASSYSSDLYRFLPYGSDFTLFRRVGLPGYNFAFIGGRANYHEPTDSIDRLSHDSLRHHGTHALALTRHLAESELPATHRAEVYFNLPVIGLLPYPAAWSPVLAVLLALGVAGALFSASRRGVVSWRGALLVAAGQLLAVVLVAGLALVLSPFLLGLSGGDGDYFGDGLVFTIAWAAFAAALTWLVTLTAARRSHGDALHALLAGTLLVWASLTLGTAFFLPASSYLTLWPCAILLLATVLIIRGGDRSAAMRITLLALAASVVLLLWVPTIHLVGLALAPAESGAAGVLAAIAATLLASPWLSLTRPRSRTAAAVVALVALSALAVTAARAQPSAQHPEQASLIYVWDESAGEAYWTSIDLEPASVLSTLLPTGDLVRKPELFEGVPLSVVTAEAPESPVPAPRVRVVSREEGANGALILVLGVRSQRRAPHLNLELQGGEDMKVLRVDGEELSTPEAHPEFFTIRFLAAEPREHRVRVELPADSPLTYNAVDRTYSLPRGLNPELDDASVVLLPMTLARTAGEIKTGVDPTRGEAGDATGGGDAQTTASTTLAAGGRPSR